MGYYIRTVPGFPPQAWKIEGDVAVRIEVTNPENGPGSYFKAEPGETIWERIARTTHWFADGANPFHETALAPGVYYPRIARPIDQHPLESPGWSPDRRNNLNVIAEGCSQLIVLGRQLDRICRTVHPDASTMNAFGHDIRNLLILACTEAENHWRGVLKANGVQKRNYNTDDYVKLMPAMSLGGYSVSFNNYPWLDPFTPFGRWGMSDANTKDLPWYDAYNAVKHSRESHFSDAKLLHAFDAVSACAIMMVTQFGLPEIMKRSSDLKEMFSLANKPSWPFRDVYIYPYDKPDGEWTAINYPFP